MTSRTHEVRSITSGARQRVTVHKKVVNATHAQTAVPSTHPPKYAVAAGVNCVPSNRLPDISRPFRAYTVAGSGKTGMEAILWLLENGVALACIRWVMPRDAWLLNRANYQSGLENFERSIGKNMALFDAIASRRCSRSHAGARSAPRVASRHSRGPRSRACWSSTDTSLRLSD